MIDTLVFRLLNLSTYPRLYNLVKSNQGKEIVATRSEKESIRQELRTWIMDYRTEVAIPLRYSDKRNIPSSNHDIPFTADWTNDYLEVNVSIPKMLYGNNICELVIPPGHKDFTVNNTSPYHHIDYVYSVIRLSIPKILTAIGHGNPIYFDWADIQLVRLDLCLNQHFPSMREALRYHKYQQSMQKKYNREEGVSNRAQWKTSVTFQTKRYYAKIYHKGTEFRQMQADKIIKINNIRKKTGEGLLSSNIDYAATHIQELQEYSDKILRYELEFKQSYLNYLFNYKINKRWSIEWDRHVKLFHWYQSNEEFRRTIFSAVERYEDINGKLHKKKTFETIRTLKFNRVFNEATKERELVEWSEEQYKKYRQLEKLGIIKTSLSENESSKMLTSINAERFKSWYNDFMVKELTKSRKFMVKLPNDIIDTTREYFTIGNKKYPVSIKTQTDEKARFTKSLMRVMVGQLEDFFNNFQFRTKHTEMEFQDKIAHHNKEIERRLGLNGVSAVDAAKLKSEIITPFTQRQLLLFHKLHGKLKKDDLLQHYSKTSYHKYKKLYEKISGHKEQIASSEFSHLIERNFDKVFEKLNSDITINSPLTKLYNKGISSIGITAMNK